MNTTRYRAIFDVTGTTEVVVDAANPSEAMEKASRIVSVDLCYACGRQLIIEEIMLGSVEQEDD